LNVGGLDHQRCRAPAVLAFVNEGLRRVDLAGEPTAQGGIIIVVVDHGCTLWRH
jgi:hypothetical protein